MLGIITVLGAAALLLAACATQDQRDLSGVSMAQPRGLPWGSYPGYGWGPVPPAQTHS